MNTVKELKIWNPTKITTVSKKELDQFKAYVC